MSVKISASQVNELRKKTGAGMMDCKKALVESEGDLEKAIDLLRKKGQKVAAKREDREASEGCIMGTSTNDNKKGVIVSVNCETDFVAKNADFVALTTKVLDIAVAKSPATVEELLSLDFEGGVTIQEKLTEQTGVIGEKIEIANYKVVSGEFVSVYNHPGNRLASSVVLSKSVAGADEAGKEIAMQVAAMNPVALNREGVPADTIARELEVGKELAIQEGKPAEMADKIAQGRLNKFFKENTLLDQEYFSDNKKTVSQFLQGVDTGLTVTEFVRVSL